MKLLNFKKLFLLVTIINVLQSCDTNDNNNSSIPCDSKFFLFTGDGTGTTNDTFNIFGYQKTNGFNTPFQMLGSNQNYANTNQGVRYAKSAVDTGSNTFSYRIADMLITFNAGTNNVSQTTFNNGDNPEYLNGNLYFLKTDFSASPSVDFSIIDATNTSISATFTYNISGYGLNNRHEISSTSDDINKIYYLANTHLLTYDASLNTMSNVQLDMPYSATNLIWYFGLEYVDNNTLYALKGDATNMTVKLVKINISNPNVPQITTLKDLTNLTSLGFTPYSIVNGNAYVQSGYDDCDDSYYFTYTDPGNIQSHLIEIKLISNVINAFPSVNGRFYFGLDHY